MVKLVSGDGIEFEVEDKLVNMMTTIKEMMEDLPDDGEMVVPVASVNGNILEKVIEYLKHHVDDKPAVSAGKAEDDGKKYDPKIEGWDVEFVEMDQPVLFETILAANYLNVKGLLDLCCKAVANMIKGKNPEEIRKTFKIANDFTPEEEEQVRKENDWVD